VDRAIDFHQHLWPEAFIGALSRRERPPRLRGTVLELANGESGEVDLRAHELDARLALLDRDEIEVAVISLSPALGIDGLPGDDALELIESYEEGICELAGAAGGRLVALSTRSPDDAFVGTCVAAPALLDLEQAAPLLDQLEAEHKVLFVHPGPAAHDGLRADWWGEVVDYTAQMQTAYAAWLAAGAERWPELRVVFAILAGGGPFQLERLRSRGLDTRDLLHPNVYFDTASYGRRAIELCLATFGVGQLVYGSDTPVIDSGPTLDDVRGFGEAVVNVLCRENPARLLPT
jgi:6-methylsalicylate decarboxylase